MNDADHVPATDASKSATADAMSFLTTLNNLKTAFADEAAVASVLDSVTPEQALPSVADLIPQPAFQTPLEREKPDPATLSPWMVFSSLPSSTWRYR